MNQCDTIFALLALFDRDREIKVCACALDNDSKYAISRSHYTQGMLPFQRSREKKTYFHI